MLSCNSAALSYAAMSCRRGLVAAGDVLAEVQAIGRRAVVESVVVLALDGAGVGDFLLAVLASVQVELLAVVLLAEVLLEGEDDSLDLCQFFDEFLVVGAALERVPGGNEVGHLVEDPGFPG